MTSPLPNHFCAIGINLGKHSILKLSLSPTESKEDEFVDSDSRYDVGKFQILTAKMHDLRRNAFQKSSKPVKGWKTWIMNFLISFLLLATTILLFVYKNNGIDNCPQGFQDFLSHRGQCYHIVNDTNDWSSAKAVCQSKNGYLLEIYTLSELDYIKKIMDYSKVWFSWLGTSNQGDLFFVWDTTKQEPSFNIPWAPDFPSHFGLRSTCVSMLSTEKMFINNACFDRLPFICKTVKNKTMVQEGLDERQHEGLNTTMDSRIQIAPWAREVYHGMSTFHFFETDSRLSWTEARLFCQSKNMDLVIMDYHEKFLFIKRQIESPDFYAGPYKGNSFKENVQNDILWLGAKRLANANTQYELEWVNGIIQDARDKFWLFKEEPIGKQEKCLFTILHFYKFMFFLGNCDETSSSNRVFCEKTAPKKTCRVQTDCRNAGMCLRGNCVCPLGLAGDGCYDIDECQQESFDPCNRGPCNNSWGSYKCQVDEENYLNLDPECSPACPALSKCTLSGSCICDRGLISPGVSCMRKIFARTTSTMFLTTTEQTWKGAFTLCHLNGGSLLSDITYSQWTRIQGALAPAARYFPITIWLGGKVNEKGDLVWSQSNKLVSQESFGEDDIVNGNCLEGYSVLSSSNHSDSLSTASGFLWGLQNCTELMLGICNIPNQVSFSNCGSNNDCPANASCVYPDNDSNKKTCICNDGFEKKGQSCTDIDECNLLMNDCGLDPCINTIGSYKCDNNWINNCGSNNDCPANASCVYQDDDSNKKTCICNNGFERKGPNCTDINECDSTMMFDCGLDPCINTIGSYKCDAFLPFN